MEDKEKVEINGEIYEYSAFYDRLELTGDRDGTYSQPAIACPKCRDFAFRITYGEWECVANCKCGHSMTIYDG